MSGTPNPTPPNPSTESADVPATRGETQPAATVRCALTDEELSPEDAYWAPPIVTFRDLLGAFGSAITFNRSALPTLLFGKEDDVPYAPTARAELARRRSAEQAKLLGALLLLGALVAALLFWLM